MVQSSEKIFIEKRISNNPIFLCVFIKKSQLRFVIITIYVDDLKIIETLLKSFQTQ